MSLLGNNNTQNENETSSDKSRRNDTRLLIRGAIGVYLLWTVYTLLKGYLSGADTGISPPLLIAICVVFTAAVAALAVLSVRDWKRTKAKIWTKEAQELTPPSDGGGDEE